MAWILCKKRQYEKRKDRVRQKKEFKVVTDDEEKYKKKLGKEQRDAVSNLESFYMKITLYNGKASKVQLVDCERR
jgi:hypothetical protein